MHRRLLPLKSLPPNPGDALLNGAGQPVPERWRLQRAAAGLPRRRGQRVQAQGRVPARSKEGHEQRKGAWRENVMRVDRGDLNNVPLN